MKNSSSYYDKVYAVTSEIPFGRVSTYGAIADYLALGSARMVGWALRHCIPGIPAHRVVNRIGELSGRNSFPAPGMMEELLKNEGVIIENFRVVNFKDRFIHPEYFM